MRVQDETAQKIIKIKKEMSRLQDEKDEKEKQRVEALLRFLPPDGEGSAARPILLDGESDGDARCRLRCS